ncbi:glycerophosphodiester phosphodiesterase [Natronorarus salvus]|uniref:glycerophosphodiester phosphodiesterase n=1 Tax=Natronorarus salvus TaxID=3117733 RepID=UPI002F26AFA0
MRIVAHRGCADQYPENTVGAVRACSPHVDMIEVDVRRCGSGELVAFHDQNLSRLTGVDRRVDVTDYEEMSEFEILDSGERIPTLSELLGSVPDGVGLNLELKRAGMARELLRTIEGIENEVLVSSFVPEALWELRGHDDEVGLAPVFSERPEENTDLAVELDAVMVHPEFDLCLENGLVERAADHDLEVNAWSVSTLSEARTLAAAGVDGLITDRWDLL